MFVVGAAQPIPGMTIIHSLRVIQCSLISRASIWSILLINAIIITNLNSNDIAMFLTIGIYHFPVSQSKGKGVPTRANVASDDSQLFFKNITFIHSLKI